MSAAISQMKPEALTFRALNLSFEGRPNERWAAGAVQCPLHRPNLPFDSLGSITGLWPPTEATQVEFPNIYKPRFPVLALGPVG